MRTKVKTSIEIVAMRRSGQILAEVLELLRAKVVAGVSTQELNDFAAEQLVRLGAKPAFLGYGGFPGVLCTSVNDAVVHGIPSTSVILKNGDIVGLDFGVIYDGMITDAARTYIVGTTTKERQYLVENTELAMMRGIEQVKAGCRTGDIGAAVQEVLDAGNYGIVRDLVGHGVGHELHEDPNIPNYGRAGSGFKLEAGMTIAIEPMSTLKKHQVYVDADGWTVRTTDGSASAHFENTILITKTGFEILTV
jgi:methionyl aminopeptidase